MAELTIAVAAFAVALLTFFTGFGLGTLLLPVFAFFLPVEVAVAATAVVHGLNNLFKVAILRRSADRTVVVRFGVPAIVAAFGGAWLLSGLASQQPFLTWTAAGMEGSATPVQFVIGLLIIAFALVELSSRPGPASVATRWLPVGGLLSGFFGGLSGHQGALRAIFLTPLRLTPESFAATQAVLGLLVDVARTAVYAATFLQVGRDAAPVPVSLAAVGSVAALAGALAGRRLLPKVTPGRLQKVTAGLLIITGVLLSSGVSIDGPRTSGQPEDRSMSPTAAHHKLDYVEFPSTDQAAIKAFYNKAFGWTFTDYGPDYMSFEDGRLTGGFRRSDSAPVNGALVILYSDSLEETEQRVKDAGGKIVVPIFSFPGGRRFHFYDPSGNELAVWSDKGLAEEDR